MPRAALLFLLVAGATGCGDGAASAPPSAPGPPRGVVVGCDARSMALFPATPTAADVVVGPLTLVGARDMPAEVIREFGGNKLPALVRPGHRVTIALAERDARNVGLGFGPMPDGEARLRDTHRAVTFVPCGPGEASGSTLGGKPVTFWMGGLVVETPVCVPLRVWIDDAAEPVTVPLRLGARDC